MNSITEIKKTDFVEPEVEVAMETHEEQDLLILSLNEFEAKLKSGNCDMAELLVSALKVHAYANHKNSRHDKIFTLDKKIDLNDLAKKSEQTYNGLGVATLALMTIAAGLITMAGGGTSFVGAFSNAEKLTKIGTALAPIGQGLGMIPQPIKDFVYEGKRIGLSHQKQMEQHLFDDRHQAHLTDKRSAKETTDKVNQAFQSLHSAISELLRSSTR